LNQPLVGVAIASFRDRSLLDQCLTSVVPEADAHGVRVVVARAGDPEIARCRDRWPGVGFVVAPAGASVPVLRGLAMKAVGEGRVALIEDHCVAAPGWLAMITSSDADVVGGAMGNAQTARLVDWGAFFSEYGFFASARVGQPPLVTGANVAYGPRVAPDVRAWAEAGEWEDVIHGRLLEAGRSFAFVVEARVLQNQSYRVAAFLEDRFSHGFQYARKRLAEQGARKRWLWAAGVVALPLVLAIRVGRAAWSASPSAFVRSLGYTVLFLSAWAVGEGAGYLRGVGPRPAR